MLYVVIDLSSKLTPQRAVAELEGLRFKRTEHRMKRYTRGTSMAEAVLDGPLRVMKIQPVASAGAGPVALLVDRRWQTTADFPWTSYMDTESILLQHTTHLTHRVTLVCETGVDGAGSESVRIEWDFASGKKKSDDDHAERVDWLLARLDAGGTPASLTLKRLLREHKGLAQSGVNGEGTEQDASVRSEDAQDIGGGQAGQDCEAAGCGETEAADAACGEASDAAGCEAAVSASDTGPAGGDHADVGEGICNGATGASAPAS